MIFARRPLPSHQLVFGNGEHHRTLTKEHIPEDRVGTHLGVDGDDTSSNELIFSIYNIHVFYALVDLAEIVIHLLEPLPRC